MLCLGFSWHINNLFHFCKPRSWNEQARSKIVRNQPTSALLQPVADKQSDWPILGRKYLFCCETLAALTSTSFINQHTGTLCFGGTSEAPVLTKIDYQKLRSQSSEIGSEIQMCKLESEPNTSLSMAKACFYFHILWYVPRQVKSLKSRCPYLLTDSSTHWTGKPTL